MFSNLEGHFDRIEYQFQKDYELSKKKLTSKDTSYSLDRVISKLKGYYEFDSYYSKGSKVLYNEEMTISFRMLRMGDFVDPRDVLSELYERVVCINGLYIEKEYQNRGLGSALLRDLLEFTDKVSDHLSYILFPYLDCNNQDYNVGLGKFYLKQGGKILRSSNEKIEKPHVYTSKKIFEVGIGPIALANMRNWGDFSDFIANPEELSELQRKYFL